MGQKSIVVMGATGQIGHALTEELLKRGASVKIIATHLKSLEDVRKKGAVCVQIEGFDRSFSLAEAFSGADALFSVLPPSLGGEESIRLQNRASEAIVTALKKAHIRYIVNLSSLGAEHAKGTGPITALHRHENRLNSLKNVNIIHLRTAYSMENLIPHFLTIHQQNRLITPLRGDLPIPMVANADIVKKAADLLTKLSFRGVEVFPLVGPRAITLVEVAFILGKTLGKNHLPYMQETYEEARRNLLALRLSPSAADYFLEMYRAINEERIAAPHILGAAHIGETTLEEFAKQLRKNEKENTRKIA